MQTTTQTTAAHTRHRRLRTTLETWRRRLGHHVHGQIRDLRDNPVTEGDVLDAAESSELGIQDDIACGVIQIHADTLNQINAALRRIDEGDYGRCVECGGGIADVRLRALPFAIRCKPCEDARERADVVAYITRSSFADENV